MQRATADTGDLENQHRRRIQLACVRRFAAISRAPTEIAGHRVDRILGEVTPLALGPGEARTSLEHEHIEAPLRELLGDHGAAPTCADHDHVTNRSPPFLGQRSFGVSAAER